MLSQPAQPKPAGRPTLYFERVARRGGSLHVAGVDEVGRGCLFGPVVAAAVILDPSRPIRGLDDSKVLDQATRETLAARIRDRAVACSTAAVDAATIDQVNIYQASRIAMELAVAGLTTAADYLLVDAMKLAVSLPQRALIHGDARSRSIAAASIVAKVERDAWMRQWHEAFPVYNLASNKGYATPDHLAALAAHGPSPLHRLSFEPVAAVAPFPGALPARAAPRQTELFAAAGGSA